MAKTNPSNIEESNLLKSCLQSLIVSHRPLHPENKPLPLYKTKKTKIVFSDENKTHGFQEYLRDMSDLYNVSWNKGVGYLKLFLNPM